MAAAVLLGSLLSAAPLFTFEPDWLTYRDPSLGTCDASNFSLDLGNTRCPDLNPNTAAQSPDECMKECCGTPNCETWQWCAPGLPCDSGFWAEAGALSAGGDLDGWPQNTTIQLAESACSARKDCIGLTYHATDLQPIGVLKIWLKNATSRISATLWSRHMKASPGCFLGELHRACANASDGWTSRAKPPPPTTKHFVSATLGSHMVLQRAPQRALLWGHTAAGATVTVTFDGAALPAVAADAEGVWRLSLPATEASRTAHTFVIQGSGGESATLTDVLFGDVFLCGGQSNMVFAMGSVENATAEIDKVRLSHDVRLFTLGQGTSSQYPLADVQTVEQPWTHATNATISGGGIFGVFSAVCWFFAAELKATRGLEDVPLGLVSNSWGGTRVEQWMDVPSMQACGLENDSGNLYNAMHACRDRTNGLLERGRFRCEWIHRLSTVSLMCDPTEQDSSVHDGPHGTQGLHVVPGREQHQWAGRGRHVRLPVPLDDQALARGLWAA